MKMGRRVPASRIGWHFVQIKLVKLWIRTNFGGGGGESESEIE